MRRTARRDCPLRVVSSGRDFADPKVYPHLEAEGYFYAIRLIGNAILHDKIEHL